MSESNAEASSAAPDAGIPLASPAAAGTSMSAPPPSLPLPLAYASAHMTPYVSAVKWSKIIGRWLWVVAIAHLLMVWPAAVGLLNRIAYAREPAAWEENLEAFEAYDGPFPLDLVNRFIAVAGLVGLVYWMMWVYRTYRNLTPLGATGLRHSPGWAVWFYFIPIVHLFRPFQVMHETWRASDPAHAGGTHWHEVPKPRLVDAWWCMRLALLAGVLVAVALEIYAFADETIDPPPSALVASAALDVLTTLLVAAVTVVEIWVVRRVTALQELRAGRVGTMPPARG